MPKPNRISPRQMMVCCCGQRFDVWTFCAPRPMPTPASITKSAAARPSKPVCRSVSTAPAPSLDAPVTTLKLTSTMPRKARKRARSSPDSRFPLRDCVTALVMIARSTCFATAMGQIVRSEPQTRPERTFFHTCHNGISRQASCDAIKGIALTCPTKFHPSGAETAKET